MASSATHQGAVIVRPPFLPAAAWHANEATVYVQYTSNDVACGLDLTKWTQTFTLYVQAALAREIAVRVTDNIALAQHVGALETMRLENALGIDAVTTPTGMLPFNVTARNPVQSDAKQAERIMPFNRPARMAAQQPQPQGGG